jgi:hypothetical protein
MIRSISLPKVEDAIGGVLVVMRARATATGHSNSNRVMFVFGQSRPKGYHNSATISKFRRMVMHVYC